MNVNSRRVVTMLYLTLDLNRVYDENILRVVSLSGRLELNLAVLSTAEKSYRPTLYELADDVNVGMRSFRTLRVSANEKQEMLTSGGRNHQCCSPSVALC